MAGKGNSFPDSAFSYGRGKDYTTGDTYYVDSGATNASDGNDGKSPDTPLATTNGAADKVTANQGDIVFWMPGHTEDLDAATDVVIDVAGVRWIGLGVGDTRPTFTYSGTAGSFEIDAADTWIENVVFKTSVSACVVGVNVDADDVTLMNCEWTFDASGDDFLIFVDIDAVDRCDIIGCRFIAEDAAGSNRAIRLDDTQQTRIIGNYFFGDFAQAVINTSSGGGVSAGLFVVDNIIVNRDTASSQNGISFEAAHTGMIKGNSIGTLQATDVMTLLDPGSCLCVENYVVNAIDEHAVLAPSTSATSG